MNNQICGLNYLDVLVRKGAIPLEKLGSKFPVTLGVEAAGTVEEVGDKVEGVVVGERVAYVVIGSGECFIFYTACTSHGNCTDRILHGHHIQLNLLKRKGSEVSAPNK